MELSRNSFCAHDSSKRVVFEPLYVYLAPFDGVNTRRAVLLGTASGGVSNRISDGTARDIIFVCFVKFAVVVYDLTEILIGVGFLVNAC